MNEKEKAYIAGLIDGEGCITIAKHKSGQPKGKMWYYQPIITLANTDKTMINYITERYECNIVKQQRRKENYKQMYWISFTGDRLKIFLNDILPYLVCKRTQARIVLNFPNYAHRGWGWGRTAIGRTEEEINKQNSLFLKIRKLNSRGVKPFIEPSTENKDLRKKYKNSL